MSVLKGFLPNFLKENLSFYKVTNIHKVFDNINKKWLEITFDRWKERQTILNLLGAPRS